MQVVVGDVAGGNALVAVVLLAERGGARVATVVATAVATGKTPEVLHASSPLTPSVCGSWLVTRPASTRLSPASCGPPRRLYRRPRAASCGGRCRVQRSRRAARVVAADAVHVLLVVDDAAGCSVIVAGVVLAAEGDA